MSTKFYYGQVDYIQKLNELDDAVSSVIGTGALLKSGGIMTGQLQSAPGTLGLPGISIGNTTSGLYSSGADEVGLSAGGVSVWKTYLGSFVFDVPVTFGTSVSASSFIGPLIGNATTASALQTSRTIALSGDVTGTTSFDGSTGVTISTSIDPASDILAAREGSGAAAIYSGGLLSINSGNNARLDISAVHTVFTDYSTPSAPTATVSTFGPFTDIILTSISSQPATYIGINSSGVIQQQSTPFTASQRRTIIQLGIAIHSNNTIINAVNQTAGPAGYTINQLQDLFEALGALNISGNAISANGANLNINKSAGVLMRYGCNFPNDPSNPHQKSFASSSALTFRYRNQNSVEGADTISINPTQYDNAGVLTTVGNNNYSVQRVYLFQSGLVRIQYGQAVYATMAVALSSVATENFITEANMAANGVCIAYIALKGNATSLNDPAQARFVNLSKFGATSGSAGTAFTSADIINVLGYTPYNAANPSNYTSRTGNEIISGTWDFSVPVSGVAPTISAHLATKGYVDSKSISVSDEGSSLTTSLSSINFVGGGVTATTVGNDVTVSIAGGGGGSFDPTITQSYGGTASNEAVRINATGTTNTARFEINGAATGSSPSISVQGSAANIDLTLMRKGVGGYNLYAPDANPVGLEVGISPTGDRSCFIDWHSDTTNTDFSYRIIRNSGVNGNTQYIQAGTGTHLFTTNGSAANIQFAVAHTPSAVNYLQVNGNISGSTPFITATGPDTNVSFSYFTKGSGSHIFRSHSGPVQFTIAAVAAAVNNLQVSGAATGNTPLIDAVGTDANINVAYHAKGTGVHVFRAGGSTNQFLIATAVGAVNSLQVAGSTTGNPVPFQVAGSDTNISIDYRTKGTGSHLFRNAAGNTQFEVSSLGASTNYPASAASNGGDAGFYVAGTSTDIGMVLTTKGTGALKLNPGGSARWEVRADGVLFSNLRGDTVVTAAGNPKLRSYVTGSLPSAATEGAGTIVRDSTTSELKMSDGAAWVSTGGSSGFDPTITQSYGGTSGNESFKVLASGTTNTSFLQVQGTATSPIIGLVGTPANISFEVYTKGSGEVSFRQAAGGTTYLFRALGMAGTAANHLVAVASATGGAGILHADGTDTNVTMRLTTKGNGAVTFAPGSVVKLGVLSTGELRHFTNSNDVITAAGNIKVRSIATASLPSASTEGAGTIVRDSTSNELKMSNGTSWSVVGALVPLGEVLPTGASSSADFLNSFSSEYDEYELHFGSVQPMNVADTLSIRLAVAGAPVTASAYYAANPNSTDTSLASSYQVHGATQIPDTTNVDKRSYGIIRIKLSSTKIRDAHISGDMTYYNSPGTANTSLNAGYMITQGSAVTGVQLLYIGGNAINSDSWIRLYGIRKN